jgi:hypothetical protein
MGSERGVQIVDVRKMQVVSEVQGVGRSGENAKKINAISVDMHTNCIHYAGSVLGRAARKKNYYQVQQEVFWEKDLWCLSAAKRSNTLALGTADGLVQLINY